MGMNETGGTDADTGKGEGARTRGSGSESVYKALRHEILTMERPPGSPLDETRLSEHFGMSRTPIREALLRLTSEGLVTSLPNRNTIVAVIDFSSLPTYFEALCLMYRVTTRGAAKRSGDAWMAEIIRQQQAFSRAVEAQDAFAMIEANREFHVAIAERAGNPYYTTFFARLLDEGRRILRLYYQTFDDRLPRRYVEEHEKIIEAIRAGDVEEADRLSVAHADQIVRQIQDYVARNITAAAELPDI
ncbi:DNA-binding transcriptional regulator, GntR family [Rhizobium sp. RU33A]|uniref:GntR family transcriptional regulator n=1 Tax=Rhizobium sp. RU33A TaxID=1907413 RepID=UPI0009566237|nr:GntR family transcriptional regulator [Rhizobium sp. RU33A]SIQ54705.1 DNA-binding transcriptional regulator, GntR family [Rhizobium sp. RU33A]